MAYLLEDEPLSGEGGKVVFEGKEVARIDNLKIEPVERAEIDLSGIRELTDEIGLLNMRPKNPNGNGLGFTVTIRRGDQPEFDELMKDFEAEAIVQTWRRIKEANK
jgi:hypothetical protein